MCNHLRLTCHQVGGKYGKIFGPDLGSFRNRDAASIMADILNPNRSIAVTYEMWAITKKNGEKLVALIPQKHHLLLH